MNPFELRQAVTSLQRTAQELEDLYEYNEGEVTAETEYLEERKNALAALIDSPEGVEDLGRHIVEQEARVAALKAEEAMVASKRKGVENRIAADKALLYDAILALKKDKVKGTCYSFEPKMKTTTEVDKTLLGDLYKEKAVAAMRKAGIPEYVGLSLTASVKAVPEGEELPSIFMIREEKSCTFRKPRKVSE